MKRPYVGDGADGARRSAQIDREEAATYPTGSAEAERCLASARCWDEQADMLDAHPRDKTTGRWT